MTNDTGMLHSLQSQNLFNNDNKQVWSDTAGVQKGVK